MAAALGGVEVLAVEFHGCKTFEIADDGANIGSGAAHKKMDMLGHDGAGVDAIALDLADGGKRQANGAGLNSREFNGRVRQRFLGEYPTLELLRVQSSAGDRAPGFQFGGGATGVKQIPRCDKL